MTDTIFSSSDALIDSLYDVTVVNIADPAASPTQQQKQTQRPARTIELALDVPNRYRLRFRDRLNNGKGEPSDAAVVLEEVSPSPGGTTQVTTTIATWPIEYVVHLFLLRHSITEFFILGIFVVMAVKQR